MASQITSPPIVNSTVYSNADQRKHQSSASLAFVRGIHRWPVNSPHKWPVTRKMFPFDDVIIRWIQNIMVILWFLISSSKPLRKAMTNKCQRNRWEHFSLEFQGTLKRHSIKMWFKFKCPQNKSHHLGISKVNYIGRFYLILKVLRYQIITPVPVDALGTAIITPSSDKTLNKAFRL